MINEAWSVEACGDDLLRIVSKVDLSSIDLSRIADGLRELQYVLESVAGFDEIIVQYDPMRQNAEQVRQCLSDALKNMSLSKRVLQKTVCLPICYDFGHDTDLEFLAEKLEISQEELIEKHLSRSYEVFLVGFLPGFAYCGSLHPDLEVSRLDTPKRSVPAGSVGIAGSQTGLYAVESPAGWPIIGRVAIPLFNPISESPFLLEVGTKLQFKRIERYDFERYLDRHVS